MTTQDAADWDEKTEARKMLREWIRMPHQKNDADCIEFFGHHLSLARSTAPSAGAMREAAAKVSEDYNGTVSTRISVRTASSEDLEREYTRRSGERAAARAIAQKIRALPPAQPAAVGDATPAMESVTAEALPLDAALSSIPLSDATHDPYGHIKCWAFPPGCDTIEACKTANECAKAHPSSTTGYQPAAGPTQGHPGHGATMDGVPLVTLVVPVGEIEAVQLVLAELVPLWGRAASDDTLSKVRSFLARLQSPTPAGEIKIADLVTTEMRQAAIDYYSSVHKEHVLTPIGDINGIIYAALSASPAIRGFLSRASTLPAILTPIPTAEIEARGTHRLLAQWVTIIERREDGVRVRYEDGSISREIISYDLIVDMEAVGRLQSPTPAGRSCHIDRLVACVHDWNDAFQDQHYKAAPEYVPMLRDTLSAIHRAVLAALGAGLCPEDAVVLGVWVKRTEPRGYKT